MNKIFLFLFISLNYYVFTQAHKDTNSTENENGVTDFLKRGHFSVHLRSMSMFTINDGSMKDFYGIGLGGGLEYITPTFKGISFAVSGFAIFDMASSDFTKNDSVTGMGSRYELALFDMNEPNNRMDLDRLELLYLQYDFLNTSVRLGRQLINTPFLNEQDNRMRPNLFSGGYSESTFFNSLKWRNAIISGVSPRGTVDWYSIESSFGVYPFGRNVDGNPSEYLNNTKSKGLFISGLDHVYKKGESTFWYYHAENIFNLFVFQNDHLFTFSDSTRGIRTGFQGFYQSRSGNGGNSSLSESYYIKGAEGIGIGTRIGWETQNYRIAFNQLWISDRGRFLFPREWGRERFYVSLPRDRYEGMGGVNGFTFTYEQLQSPSGWNGLIGFGMAFLPHYENYELNKYGLPSYFHYAGRLKKTFYHKLKGLSGELMMVYKQSMDDPSEIYQINRVDMFNFTLSLDYKF